MSVIEKFKVSSRANFVWNPDEILMYLYDCNIANTDAKFDFPTEGYCLNTNGFYKILDTFCDRTGYAKSRISISTGNMLEQHTFYNIIKAPRHWYELAEIQKWANDKNIKPDGPVTKHFASFIGRSTWDRLWIASYLYKNHKDKTLQTFHSGYQRNYMMPKQFGFYDPLGLEELNTYECPHMLAVSDFLQNCPLIEAQEIESIRTTPMIIEPYIDGIYPIQHPANLNILPKYRDIFVDIICESRIMGNTFLVTEKTWRCILAQRPFIVIGPTNFLHNLQRLGFITFDDFWNEIYDQTNNQERLHRIEDIIEEISCYNIDKLNTMLAKMKPIFEHNLRIFHSLNYDKIKKIFQ